MTTETTISILVDEQARRNFERAWASGQPKPIGGFLPDESNVLYLGTLLELVQIEMEFAWKSRPASAEGEEGQRFAVLPRVEAYLAAYPRLAEPGFKLTLLRHEHDIRHRFGDKPAVEEYRRRFPDLVVTGNELLDETTADEGKPQAMPEVPGYRVLGILGHGGMGIVYRANQLRLKRDVALKMLSAGPLARADELGRFLVEAESVARLQHPNIVQIFEVGEHMGRPFLALELVDGGSLAQRLSAGPLPAQQAARWVEVLARTMQHVHEHGIVHRDLKPANVLLTSEGVLKITDFGLAKRLGEAGSHTLTGAVMGTASYTSPEQAAGRTRSVGPAADVYGLGAILYEMLTGRPPFQAESTVETILQVIKDEPVSVSRLRPRTSRDLGTICHKCLQKEPQRRYASAGALAEDLRRYLAGEPILARPMSRVGRAWRWARRNPALASMGTLAVASLIAVAIVSTSLAFHHARAARAIAREKKKTEAALADALAGKREAEAAKLKLGELSGGLLLDQSVNYCQQRDVRAGILWMTRALQLAPPEAAELQWATRAELEAWSREVNAPRLPPLTHLGSIVAAAFSPDGSLFVTGSEDDTARVWETATGNAIGRVLRHSGAVRSVAISPEGTRVVTASDDGTARLWDLRTGAAVGMPMPHDGPVHFAAFTANGKTIATGSLDGTARLWDAKTTEPIGPPLQAGGQVAAMALSPDGRLLVTAAKTDVRMWDVATGLPVGLVLHHTLPVVAVAFDDSGQLLATGCGSAGLGEARLWDVGPGDLHCPPLPHPDRVGIVAFQPGGGFLATGCDDGAARLWQVAALGPPAGRPVAGAAQGSHRPGESLRNGTSPATNGLGGTSAGDSPPAGDSPGPGPYGEPLRHREKYPIRALAFSRDGKLIATGCADNSAKIWNVAGTRPIGTGISQDGSVLVVAFSPDDSILLTAGNDKTARLWSVAQGQSAGAAKPLGTPPPVMALSADGRLRLAITPQGSAVLEDAATGQPLGPPLLHTGGDPEVVSVALSADGSLALTGGRDYTARLWEARTGNPVGTPIRHADVVRSVAFTPDGRAFATGCDDKSVHVWDAKTGQPIGKPLPQRGPVQALAFSPDSRLLAAGCSFLQDGIWHGQARIWDVTTGGVIGQPLRHDKGVTAVAFSADGRVIATASRDRTARFWEADGGRPLGPPLEHPGEVVSMSFAPDGRSLITICAEKPEKPVQRSVATSAPVATAPAAPSTAPGGTMPGPARDYWQCAWRTPVAVEGPVDLLTAWAQVLTGLEFDTTNVIHRLDNETWLARRSKLESMGHQVR